MTNNLLIYGAVTPPRDAEMALSPLNKIKEVLDRLRVRLGQYQHLDYRHHLTPSSFNRGDLAIALAVEQTVQKLCPEVGLSFAEWESLDAHHPGKPVLVGGSGYFFIDKQGQLPHRLRADTSILLDHEKRYAFYGVGLNHVHESSSAGSSNVIHPRDEDLVRRLLSKASFVSVRDQQTLNALQPYADSPIFLSGDPALFLTSARAKPLEDRLTKQLRIGINIPFHGPAAADRVRKDLPKYIDCFRRLQRATSADLFFLVHFDTARLIGRLLQDAGVDLTIVSGTVETLQSTYSTLDLHVGGMLHSCILSCSVGTPCVGLAYDVKHLGFFELMQMPEYCVPSQPFRGDAVLDLCLTALQQGPALRARIDGRRERLRATTEAYLREALPRLLADS